MRNGYLTWLFLLGLASTTFAFSHWEEEVKADLLLSYFDEDHEEELLEAYHTGHAKRQFGLPGYPPGDYMNGWQSLPTASDADGVVTQKWTAAGGSIPVYQTTRTASQITRAVIIPPGMMRDCWYYYKMMQSALVAASQNDTTIKEQNIDVMSPCFLGFMDLNAGAAQSGNFVWNRTTWVSGQYNVNSDTAVPQRVSSYDIMDELVDYYMDKTVHPNLKSVVIAGHSAGAQMVQRYMLLRTTTRDDERLQFWIGNPSSFAWLTEDRPRANSSCVGTDSWKYGLSDKMVGYGTAQWERLGRSGLVARYLTRYAHYIWGTADTMVGDTRCQACTQGTSHYSRGANFAANLYKVAGNKIPSNTTVQYLNVWHDVDAIAHQSAGWEYLFRWLPGTTALPPSPTNPPTNPDTPAGGFPGFPGGFPGFPGMPSCPTTSAAPGATTTTSRPGTPTTTTSAPAATQSRYGQCGGTGYNGPTSCSSDCTCQAISPPYYYQCL